MEIKLFGFWTVSGEYVVAFNFGSNSCIYFLLGSWIWSRNSLEICSKVYWNRREEQERRFVCFFTLTLRMFFGVFMNETGNELDEFQAHKFLDSLGETLTVVAMRDRLRQIDLDFNRRVALIEYLTVRYGKVNGPLSLCSRPSNS